MQAVWQDRGRKTSSLNAPCKATQQTRRQLDRVFLKGLAPDGGAQVEATFDIQSALLLSPGR